MSQTRHSRAAVVRVKGVSFNYLQFLWSGIGQIRQQQAQGNFAGAMGLMTSFIDYLPDSIKEQFREKAKQIQSSMYLIQSGRLPAIRVIPDLYIKGIYKNRVLQQYCVEAFQDFTDALTTQLNQLGYMENLKLVREGDADQQADWIELDKKRKQSRKRKKKKPTPEGTID